MKHQMDLVQEFHQVMQVHTPNRPTMPPPEVHNLRFRLIDEEAQELVDSINLIQYLDAIGDLLYVVNGAALAAGFTPAQVDAAFAKIHRSNMSKLWSADEIDCIPADCRAVDVGDGRYIVRRNDGKIIKSPSYTPADLRDIV
jgi:predicted HAD superfamily Cof-like phosphohydrolase